MCSSPLSGLSRSSHIQFFFFLRFSANLDLYTAQVAISFFIIFKLPTNPTLFMQLFIISLNVFKEDKYFRILGNKKSVQTCIL